MRRGAVMVLCSVLALGVPAVATAGTFYDSDDPSPRGTHMGVYAGTPGEVNHLSVTGERGGLVIITDEGNLITPGEPPGLANDTDACLVVLVAVVCPPHSIEHLLAFLGDGADTAAVEGGLPASLDGGSGDDALDGGAGNDSLRGREGADRFSGGDGRDAVEYDDDGRLGGVEASIDGVANDGGPGEGDLIGGDVESLIGTGHSDVLVGNARANGLLGDFGDDLLRGLGGDDFLLPGEGADVAEGGDGSDEINSRDGAASTGPAADQVFCDDAAGLPGAADSVFADPLDVIAGDCESVTVL